MNSKIKDTSWEEVNAWYHKSVGFEGHYYHKNVILPKLIPLLDLKENSSVLDIGCGQGILARHLPKKLKYLGLDLSASLIKEAISLNKDPNKKFIHHDATKPLSIKEASFTHGVMILSLQNIENPKLVFEMVNPLIEKGGSLTLVLNHPYFRSPRQTSWGIDETKKCQFRRIERYLSPLKIPLEAHPGIKEDKKSTWSFHYPLSSLINWLREEEFAVVRLEEWCSDKKSEGKQKKMENFARAEFPLFMTLQAIKL
jgi:ubiquinone/menaquinone biosynthesis C-methylase UbiE